MNGDFNFDRLSEGLGDIPIGRNLVYHPQVDSTNDTLSRAASQGVAHGAVVIAETQTSGRGRRRRNWFSPPGLNIYTSILLREGLQSDLLPFLVYLAGLAVVEAVSPFLPSPPFLKWPNDVHVAGKKLCGILCESMKDRNGRAAILGIGLNVNAAGSDFADDLRDSAVSLKILTGKTLDRTMLLAMLYRAVDRLYKDLLDDKDRIARHWKRLAEVPYVEYTIDRDGDLVTGMAVDLEPDGALLLKTAGGLIRIYHGDVVRYRRRGNHAAGH